MASPFSVDEDYSSDALEASDHAGASSSANQRAAMAGSTPTKALIGTWVVAVALYWLLHVMVKGDLS